MLHHPVGDREPGGGVVELDVAGEGRLAGEHDRRRVDRERDRRGRRPPTARSGRAPAVARARSRRSRPRPPAAPPARRSRRRRGELADDDDRRQADRDQQRPREPDAGRPPRPAGPNPSKQRQDRRKHQPGDQERHERFTLPRPYRWRQRVPGQARRAGWIGGSMHRVSAVRNRNRGLPSDLTAAERSTVGAVRPFTMTRVERIQSRSTQAVRYCVRAPDPRRRSSSAASGGAAA